jgi:hypothetical protein
VREGGIPARIRGLKLLCSHSLASVRECSDFDQSTVPARTVLRRSVNASDPTFDQSTVPKFATDV